MSILMCGVGNCPSGELSVWGIVRVGNCPVGNCPSGELSSGELSVYRSTQHSCTQAHFLSTAVLVLI